MSCDYPVHIVAVSPWDTVTYTPSIHPMYVVLGMLNEYMGRQDVNGKDYIENFYPKENTIVDIFIENLNKLSEVENINSKI